MRKVAAASICSSEASVSSKMRVAIALYGNFDQGCIPLDVSAVHLYAGCVGHMRLEASRVSFQPCYIFLYVVSGQVRYVQVGTS